MTQTEIKPGDSFWEIYQGQTLTGFGLVSKIWEVEVYLGDGLYKCYQISNNTVLKVNPNYREVFHISSIEKFLIETPIINLK